MFQYAYAKRLEQLKGVSVKLDISDFDNAKQIGHTPRTYQLKYFNISLPIASEEEINQYKPKNVIEKYSQKFSRKFLPTNFQSYVAEKLPYYDPRMLAVNKNCIITGYFQDYRYFYVIDSIIQEDFTLAKVLSNAASNYLREIDNTNSVGIHVRRTDYLTNKTILTYFPAIRENYYSDAISMLNEKQRDLNYFCFSDDIEWCKSYFSHLPITFIETGNNDISAAEELILLSKCTHCIIPNSSFGFWGAWLNRKHKKTIIRPKHWHINGFYTPTDWIEL